MKFNLWNKVEIIVAKGEIAHYEQFLLLPQWFQKLSASDKSECVYKCERVNYWCQGKFYTLWGVDTEKKVSKP